MVQSDMIELIDPSGNITFYDLDPLRGTTNIGCDPQNNVIIDSPGIAPFHALLDHQHKPYRILTLSPSAQVRLRGEVLAANVFRELHYCDDVELDGHTLILVEAGGGVAPGAVEQGLPPAPLVDESDKLIVLELEPREQAVEVEEPAIFKLTIVNGGPLVAHFSISVEGIDPSWVSIRPPKIELFRGQAAGRGKEKDEPAIEISIKAPRRPSSRAGAHRLTIRVGSPDYPGHVSRVAATLTLKPYFELDVKPLAPREQSVSYRRRSGHVKLPIANKGNSRVAVQLEAADSQKACSFEFSIPGEAAGRFQKAEALLGPEEKLAVPIAITPSRRRLVALRKRRFDYSVTAGVAESGLMPHMQEGTLKAAPLIGPALLALLLLLFAGLFVFLFHPASFPKLEVAPRSEMRPGSPVQFDYDATRFAGLSPTNLFNQLNHAFLRLTLEVLPEAGVWQIARSPSELARPKGSSTETPMQNVTYRLRAASIVPFLRGTSREIKVYVTPVEPKIDRFEVDRDKVVAGETVTVYWQVADAETLVLERNGIQDSLAGADLISGYRSFPLAEDTTFKLIARNSTWPQPATRSQQVSVQAPTPTPIPTPVILRFDVNPQSILAGESVLVGWEVSGADEVTIDNVNSGLPLKGEVTKRLFESTYYQLVAIKTAGGQRAESRSQLLEVLVTPQPTTTPIPIAPQIMVFEPSPKEVVAGKGERVRLTWSVSDDATDITITAPNLALSGLKAQDSITVTVDETTLFVLTAFNGELKASLAREVRALEPTATPTPTPTPTPAPTPLPAPVIAFFKADPVDADDSVVFLREDPGPSYVYQAVGGSHARLSWEVRNAEEVSLTNYGPQPALGSFILPNKLIARTVIMLTAKGGGKLSTASIVFEIISPEPPPPPDNVTGYEDSAARLNTIYWTYSFANQQKITGFRVYRADFPPGNQFDVVASIYDVEARSYENHLDPTCGRAYYVVALYIDYATGNELETEASDQSWYSRPCH